MDLDAIKPDALYVGLRTRELTPLAGHRGESVTERVFVSRYDKIVAVTTPHANVLAGDAVFNLHRDIETAQVDFANQAEALRRDGWTLREGEAWEIAAELDAEEVPF